MTSDDELAAIWRATEGHRFQNYRARFTVLDQAKVSRAWIQRVLAGEDPLGSDCPEPWRSWIGTRSYTPLLAPATTVIRSKADQLPEDAEGQAILGAIRHHFHDRPHDFEACAVAIWRLMAPSTGTVDVTRPSRDGGRDAVDTYVLGPTANPIAIDFALEAKCYSESNSVGVREVSRLISRLRHRNFGVLVTTSFFHRQVQEEVHEDGHPHRTGLGPRHSRRPTPARAHDSKWRPAVAGARLPSAVGFTTYSLRSGRLGALRMPPYSLWRLGWLNQLTRYCSSMLVVTCLSFRILLSLTN